MTTRSRPSEIPSSQPPLRVVIDECVGGNSPLWQAFHAWLRRRPIQVIYLRERHQGIPDGVILARLLEPGDLLVTMDRVLHNRACKAGIASFTMTPSGQMTRKPLRGIPSEAKAAPEHVPALRDNYVHRPSPVTSALRRLMTERELKGYRSCRRRIRSAFDGQDNVSQLSLTIGAQNAPSGTLCGFYLQISGHGRQGLNASEGYSVDTSGAQSVTLAPLRALMEVYLLDLEAVHADAYLMTEESHELCQRLTVPEFAVAQGSLEHGLQRLLLGFRRLRLNPCRKGPLFDRMTRKLQALSRGGSNEVKRIDFSNIALALSGEFALAQDFGDLVRSPRDPKQLPAVDP